MIIDEVSLAAFSLALAAGIASFLSPCVLPLLPGYLSFVSGVSVDRLQVDTRRVAVSTTAFVGGFTFVFVTLGAGAGLVGDVLLVHRGALQTAAGVFLVVLGLVVTGILPIARLQRERRLLPFRPPRGAAGALVTGIAFAVGWTPCVGPILASILTLAATADPLGGAVLLTVYSLGLGLPFLLSGLFFTRAMGTFSWVKDHFGAVKVASGMLLVVYGVLMISGRFTWLSGQLAGYSLFEF